MTSFALAQYIQIPSPRWQSLGRISSCVDSVCLWQVFFTHGALISRKQFLTTEVYPLLCGKSDYTEFNVYSMSQRSLMLSGMKATDEKMASLTQEDILDRINNKNVSQIFLKEKNFKAIIILLLSTLSFAWFYVARIVPWSCTV